MEKIEIAEELKNIRARNAEVSSTTVLKTDTLRVVLMVLKSGAKLPEHHADGRLLLQVLEGEIEFTAENVKSQLTAGTLASVEAKVPHAVAALSEAILLLTIVWHKDEVENSAHRDVGYE